MASSPSYPAAGLQLGQLYWLPDADQGWVRARLQRILEMLLELELSDGAVIRLNQDQAGSLIPAGTDSGNLANVQDLTQLDRISIASLLATLRIRFLDDMVYTYAGLTLVSVNPFKPLPDQYGEGRMAAYLDSHGQAPPHIYAVAQRCLQNLIETQKPQSLIICGDSGAGKTEAAKYALQYLVRRSAHLTESDQIRHATNQIQNRIIQCNPILEAFGNAETIRNENSSRFGKYLEISVEKNSGVIRSASMTYFMLETSRITGHALGERCFHAFYSMLLGLDAGCLQDLYGLKANRSSYRILTAVNNDPGSTVTSPGRRRRPSIPSLKVKSASEEWPGIVSAMNQIGMTEDEIHAVSNILAAILHLGQISFESDADNHAHVVENDHLTWFLRLTSFDRNRCLDAFTCRHLGQSQHTVQVPIDVSAAESGCNALAKEMYGRLFRWIVARINVSLQNIVVDPGDSLTTIGILDVFGFERFDDRNGFEQICINYCNERLQGMFIESVLSVTEQAIYAAEGVEWSSITMPDCTSTLSLIETILKLLDDECIIPQGSSSNLFTKIAQTSSSVFSDDSRRRPLHFTITHYAGKVQYDLCEFMTKNGDRISDDLNDLLETASSSVMHSLTSSATPFSVSTEMQADDPVTSRRSTAKKGRFQAGQFRGQVQHLMNVLQSTTPNFIRCIKPNHGKHANVFEHNMVLDQLGNAGVLELVRVRQTGFPIRIAHDAVRSRYQLADQSIALELFLKSQLNPRFFVIGKSLVFLKDEGHAQLEALRVQLLTRTVLILQTGLRALHAASRFRRWRLLLTIVQASIRVFVSVRAQARRKTIVAAIQTLIVARSAQKTLQSILSVAKQVDLNQIEGVDAIYVTEQVVMLAFTTNEIGPVMDQVILVLRRRKSPFRIYNLCFEIEYGGSDLGANELEHFPFSGHTPCPFKMLHEFCDSVANWISTQSGSLAIVHSKGGRGRCSLMIGAHLLHQKKALSPDEAMNQVAALCSDQDPDRYLAPSQRRYLHYYYRYIRSSSPMVLTSVVNLTQAVLDNMDVSCLGPDTEIWLMIATQQDDGKMRQKWIRSVSRSTTSCCWKLRKPCLLTGDVKIEVLSREKHGKVAKVLMYVCIHSAFVEMNSRFRKSDLDKIYRDVDHEKFSEMIDLTLMFESTKPGDFQG